MEDIQEIADDWAAQSAGWLAQFDAAKPTRKRREQEKSSLILTGHGLSIRVEKGTLLIRDGNTHYPAKNRTFRFFRGGIENPPRIILIDGSGEITLDAIDWLSEQDISLIRIKWNGALSSVITASGHAFDPEKVLWQRETRKDPKARVAFAHKLTLEKAKNTLATLENYVPHSAYWEKSRKNIEAHLIRLQENPPATLGDMLGAEGSIANDYFRAWRGLEIRWKNAARNPIPDDWRQYISRTALREEDPRNRNATHPVNAMLNYAYGMLCARKQIEAISEGYDPTYGIVHDRRRKDLGRTPSYALDLMEPDRPIVDRAILELIAENEFSPTDFAINAKGVCRLNPELARLVVLATGSIDFHRC